MRYRELLEVPFCAAPKLKTAATVEPLAYADVARQCRLDGAQETEHVAMLIKATREEAEAYLNRQFITATWELYLSAWPCDRVLELPRAPLQSVTSVEYRDDDGAWQTLSAADYEVQRAGHQDNPGRIVLSDDVTWPIVSDDPDSIRVTFVAGYGATAESVPARAKRAMLHQIAESFERRELAVVGVMYAPTRTYRSLLEPLKVW